MDAIDAAPELAARLRMVVARLNRQLRQQADVDLPPTRLAHLSSIEREGPVTLGDLATMERVAPATVTKVVKNLELAGLVVRTHDADDRRVVRVEVTPEGSRLLRATRTRKDAWLARRVAALTDGDLGQLDEAMLVLERLADPEGP